MKGIRYTWNLNDLTHAYELVFVLGTHGKPYQFGEGSAARPVEIQDFFIGSVPVTQALWTRVMATDANAAARQGPDLPIENVSWDEITGGAGFLDHINASPARATMLATPGARAGTFRLPSETEWEYAARGGPHWREGFRFSGSDDINAVAWYDGKHGDYTQPVGQKAPNQLGIYDLSGNVWEWCQDVFTRDVHRVPQDGTAYEGPGDERVLREGCFTIGQFTALCQTAMRSRTTTAMGASGFDSFSRLTSRSAPDLGLQPTASSARASGSQRIYERT